MERSISGTIEFIFENQTYITFFITLKRMKQNIKEQNKLHKQVHMCLFYDNGADIISGGGDGG